MRCLRCGSEQVARLPDGALACHMCGHAWDPNPSPEGADAFMRAAQERTKADASALKLRDDVFEMFAATLKMNGDDPPTQRELILLTVLVGHISVQNEQIDALVKAFARHEAQLFPPLIVPATRPPR